jgi:cytoplasmic iron level regulating protein YaaA (DUF328/UPF0246 family)
MLIALSPSKGQDFTEPAPIDTFTMPVHLKESLILVKEARKMQCDELQALMCVSDNIARLNVERFKNFHTPFTLENAKQALFAFKGDVYRGLSAVQYTADDLSYAQDHLRMLSGLYGVLRPLDLIQPYRLEMKTKLDNPRGANLYTFWGDGITQRLNEALAKQQEKILINLASNEYFKAVKPKLLEGRLLTLNFKEVKNGKARVIAVFAKRARGMMTDIILRHRIEYSEQLKQVEIAGYQYVESLSDDKQWTFTRPQPKKK